MKTIIFILYAFGFAAAKPATEERSKTTLTLKAVVESTKVTQPKYTTGKIETTPTVRCEYIHPKHGEASFDNHNACSSHCRSLTEMYSSGMCSEDGMCVCERVVTREETSLNVDEPHPTVKCVDLIPDFGEERHENDNACLFHCRSLGNGYRGGECSRGICFCSSQI